MKNVLIGIIAGIVSGMFSSGGGLILVPIYVYVLKMSEKESRATSLFCILPMVIVTAIMYGRSNFKLGDRNKMCYRRNNRWISGRKTTK